VIAARYRRGSLIDYCLQVLGLRDVSDLRLRSRDKNYMTLRKALKGVFIIVVTEKKQRRRRIRDLTEAGGQYRFEKTDSVGNVSQLTVAVSAWRSAMFRVR
jgi:hypothetical protein